jgi:uncharacterized protein (DUF1330 family)
MWTMLSTHCDRIAIHSGGTASMAAFVIGVVHELAPYPMMEYRRKAEGVMALYGGRYRSTINHRVETLEGDWLPPHGVVIAEFPSYEQAKAWYHSEEYAPLRQERMAGDRWDLIVVDGLQAGETLRSLGIATDDDAEPPTTPTP